MIHAWTRGAVTTAAMCAVAIAAVASPIAWLETNSGSYIDAIVSYNRDTLFAGGPQNQGLWWSPDAGMHWGQITPGYVYALAVDDHTDIYIAAGGGILRSSAFNLSGLTQVSSALALCFAVDHTNGHIFAATFQNGVLRSTDYGQTWSAATTGIPDTTVIKVIVAPGGLFACTHTGVYRSVNDGATWTAASGNIADTAVYGLSADSSGRLFAGTYSAVYRSTDNGTTWLAINHGLPTTPAVNYFTVNQRGDVFAGSGGGGVFLSTDHGDSWIAVDSGISNADRNITYLFTTADGHVLAGTDIFLYVTAQSTNGTSSVAAAGEYPGALELEPSYPNPVSGAGTIAFSLPQEEAMDLAVLDVTGRVVATLQSGPMRAGRHQAVWDAQGIPAGAYAVRLTAGGRVLQRLVLVAR